VLHGRTKEVLASIQGSREFSEYGTAIEEAIAAMHRTGAEPVAVR
jgi:hypothetical protein